MSRQPTILGSAAAGGPSAAVDPAHRGCRADGALGRHRLSTRFAPNGSRWLAEDRGRKPRQPKARLNANLLFRWFVGLGVDDPVGDVTVFTKNRDRLLAGEIAAKFLRAVLAQPKVKALLSDEHVAVDGPLIQARRRRLPAVPSGMDRPRPATDGRR